VWHVLQCCPEIAWTDIEYSRKARSGKPELQSRFETGSPEYKAVVLVTPPIVLQNSHKFNKQFATELVRYCTPLTVFACVPCDCKSVAARLGRMAAQSYSGCAEVSSTV
jgi:hypothetical protein